MRACQYKDALGKPGEGVHKNRLGPVALADTLATIIVGIIIAILFDVNAFLSTGLLFLLGEVLHYIFCVDTPVIKFAKGILNK